jgi:RNA polymerase sigma-70 factor (ECF subfamily)
MVHPFEAHLVFSLKRSRMSDIEALYRTYRDQVLRFFARRVPDRALAEDLTHEAFLQIHRKLHTLKEPEAAGGWIFQIVRHTLIDHHRKARPTLPLEREPIDEGEGDAIRFKREALEACLAPLVEKLPAIYAQAVGLSDLEGLTQKALADRLNLTLPGAKSRIQRGRKQLRALLESCCQFEQNRHGQIEDFHPHDPNCCILSEKPASLEVKSNPKEVTMAEPTVSKSAKGVVVRFQTAEQAQADQVRQMIVDCQSGACGCTMPEGVESMQLSEKPGAIEVNISGQNLSKEAFERAIKECGCCA